MVTWCYLAICSFPTVSVVFCSVADGNHREANECFIEVYIVDNCTITLIVRKMVNISVWSEVDFISVCTEKRFCYFYKGEFCSSAVCIFSMTVTTTPTWYIYKSNGFFHENLLCQFCKVVYESAPGQLYIDVFVFFILNIILEASFWSDILSLY